MTGSHRPRRREVEAGDVEASEGLFHEAETARGEEKLLWLREAEATAAAAVAVAVASSMAAARSGVKPRGCVSVWGRRRG